MKKNPKPLTYLVHPDLANTPEIRERVEKGHTVIVNVDMHTHDLVIGPNCYRIAPETAHLLDIADKAARRSKYPTKTKGNDEGPLATS